VGWLIREGTHAFGGNVQQMLIERRGVCEAAAERRMDFNDRDSAGILAPQKLRRD
jgi:hypothetical protein